MALQILFLGVLFIALAILSDGTYALLAGSLGQWLRRSPRLWNSQRLLAGTVYIGLGVGAALTGSHR